MKFGSENSRPYDPSLDNAAGHSGASGSTSNPGQVPQGRIPGDEVENGFLRVVQERGTAPAWESYTEWPESGAGPAPGSASTQPPPAPQWND